MTERFGLCLCGCGQHTNLARQTDKAKGHIAGQPIKYVFGHYKPSPSAKRDKYNVTKNGCWEHAGRTNANGYIHVWVDGKRVLAHRYFYAKANGSIPEGLLVCHKCDNPRCVNPDHLFLGTPKDNMVDCAQKGRRPKGEAATFAKFTAETVLLIRARHAAGESISEIARDYPVTRKSVYRIIIGKSWKHLLGP